jgi:hypothetical protein
MQTTGQTILLAEEDDVTRRFLAVIWGRWAGVIDVAPASAGRVDSSLSRTRRDVADVSWVGGPGGGAGVGEGEPRAASLALRCPELPARRAPTRACRWSGTLACCANCREATLCAACGAV